MQTRVWVGPRLHFDISMKPTWFKPAVETARVHQRGSLVYWRAFSQLRGGGDPEKKNVIRIQRSCRSGGSNAEFTLDAELMSVLYHST